MKHFLLTPFVSFVMCYAFLLSVDAAETEKPKPYLFGPRNLERTGFQQAGVYGPRYDLHTDFVMPYGISEQDIKNLDRWKEAGYVMHLMTGVSWGEYQDYLEGKFDGTNHWDEAQVDPAGNRIQHGPTVPYMVPSIAFSRYIESGLKKAVDSGVVAMHLEEPEFWARAGFSDSFKREWRLYYKEPWVRPDSSCDAQYRTSKLKYYLYRRMLDRLCSSLKEYSLSMHDREIRFYVPTHSVLNYAHWSIVSPESSLLDLPGIDGMIAQVWTGTSRTENTYRGVHAERTFESAYLEYCIMQEMVRGTDKRMYFLHDPIEDNPAYDWNDYRKNYICTLVASLLQPDVHYFEVCPWPRRVFEGRYPRQDRRREGQTIPADYATTLGTVFQQLRDLDQPEVSWEKGTDGIGVFLGDSSMFQRAHPTYSHGVAAEDGQTTDPTRHTDGEIRRFSGFYGLTLPFVKHGVPIRAVHLDNVLRFPGYLDRYKILLLSYEFQKPLHPGVHAVLADWVSRGGTLLYVGAEADPYHEARDWWNQKPQDFRTPTEHLMQSLSLERTPEEGSYDFGKGKVVIVRKHPAYFSRSNETAEELRTHVRNVLRNGGETLIERNYFLLRRGPYVVAACLNESIDETPFTLKGRFVDLLDANLPIKTELTLAPGTQGWFLDLEKITTNAPNALASSGRIENWNVEGSQLRYTAASPDAMEIATRLLLPGEPKEIVLAEETLSRDRYRWDAESATLFFKHPGATNPISVSITW